MAKGAILTPEFIDNHLLLFDNVMMDYEQPDGGFTKEEVYKRLYVMLGIKRPMAWVKGRYVATDEWTYADTASPA